MKTILLGAIAGDVIGSFYEDAVRLAVSLGGDADTMAAIAGGIAEAYYKEIPEHICREVLSRLPKEFIETTQRFYECYKTQ